MDYVNAPYPQERIVESAVGIDLHLQVEKVVEVPFIEQVFQPKEYKVEKIVEIKKDVYLDKKVYLKKVIEVPTINRIVRRVPREKIVDVYHEKVVDNIIEQDVYEEEPVNVNLKNIQARLQINDKISHMPLNTHITKEFISKQQIADFEGSSRGVAELQAENQMLSTQLSYAERQAFPTHRNVNAKAEVGEISQENSVLRVDLVKNTRERDNLKAKVEERPQIEMVEILDDSAVPTLEGDIGLVQAKNMELKSFIEEAKRARSDRYQKTAQMQSNKQAATHFTRGSTIRTSRVFAPAPVTRTSTTYLHKEPLRTSQVKISQAPVRTSYVRGTTTYARPSTTQYVTEPLKQSRVIYQNTHNAPVKSYTTTTVHQGIPPIQQQFVVSQQRLGSRGGSIRNSGVRLSQEDFTVVREPLRTSGVLIE